MTKEQQKVINELRDLGYAITVFTPEELEGVRASAIENCMVSTAYETIESLK